MRWSASLFSLSLVCLALSFGFVALSPSDAYALWDEATATDEMRYWYNGSTPPSTIKVSPIYTNANGYGYDAIIFGSARYQASSGTWRGTAWNTVPSTTSPVLIRLKSIDGGQLAEGQRFMLGDTGQYLINYTTVTTPTGTSDYREVRLNGSNFHYYVSKTGNANKTEIFPDSHGTFTAPFDVQYVFIVSNVNLSSISSAKFWYVYHDFSIMIERPEDQNEVAAINNQTDTLMNTDGSDGIANDQVVGGQVQQIENLDIFGFMGDVSQNVDNAITTQEENTGVSFPGMNLFRFSIPAATIDPMSNLSEPMQANVKTMVTFVFCSAFISHIIQLAHAIFGIWEYGVGAEEFGNGEYSFTKVKNWSADYSIDEDLGF